VKRTEILVIDEVSLLNGQLLDRIDAVAREVRNDRRPLGGIRLILVGDFSQLEPFPLFHRKDGVVGVEDVEREDGKHVFQSEVWKNGNFQCFKLLICHRYCADSELGQLLQKCREVETMGRELLGMFES
jgi:hypothetical protein